jgi:hypothetical protein
MRLVGSLCIVLLLAILSACASEEAPLPTVTNSVSNADPLSGTWKGDWGLTGANRNPVTLALAWDGTNLAGSMNPGPDAVSITKGSFAPDTGSVTIEATGNGSTGVIHYTAEGKLSNGAISGTWMDGDKKGDFKITKS